MNGDGLSDVVQFDRNGGYRVSLRRTNGTLAPVMSQRQWEASLQHQVAYPEDNASYGNFAGAEAHSYSSLSSPSAASLGYSHQGRWVHEDNTGVALLGDSMMAMPVPMAAFAPPPGRYDNSVYTAFHGQHYNAPYHTSYYYSW